MNVYNFNITEIEDACIANEVEWEYDFFVRDDKGKGYCKVFHIAPLQFEIIFPIYFALDLIKFVGDETTIRVLVLSILAATQSFLMFLFWNYMLDELRQYEMDVHVHSYKYAYSWLSGSNFILFFLSLVLMVMALWKRNQDNDTPKMNSVLMKIIGSLMLISLGGSLMLMTQFRYLMGSQNLTDWMESGYLDEWRELIVPAVILVVYETQYL